MVDSELVAVIFGVLSGMVTFGVAWGTFSARLKRVEEDVMRIDREMIEQSKMVAHEFNAMRERLSEIDKNVGIAVAILQEKERKGKRRPTVVVQEITSPRNAPVVAP